MRSCLITFVVLRTWIYSASDLLLILSVDSLASAVYGDATFSFINMFVVKKNEYNHRFCLKAGKAKETDSPQKIPERISPAETLILGL